MKDPNFDIAFTIGKFNIYWYAILLAAGIAAALIITDRRSKGRNVTKDIALDLCILGVPFGVLGARLFACISGAVAWSDFFDLTRSGLSFFGGLIAATLAILMYLSLRKVDLGEMLDIAAPGVFVGIGIDVWGDFFNRSHYGPLVEKAAHKWFPLATFGNDLKIHYAAFFYEFLLCVILVVAYYAILRSLIHTKANRFVLMALIYCLGRYTIDSIRQDIIMVGPIAFDQIIEIILIVILLLVLLLGKLRKQDPPAKAKNTEEAAETTADVVAEADKKDDAREEAEEEPVIIQPEKENDFTGLN